MSIYRLPGNHGEISVGTLPSGDLTVRGSGDSAVVSLARSVAMRYQGSWNEHYRNWIVPNRHGQALLTALSKSCWKVG